MEERANHYLFLINQKSGTGEAPDWKSIFSSFFESSVHSWEIYELPKKIDLKFLKRDILNRKPDIVVAVGGDGTVSLAANIIADTVILLGLIPQGSANGMAAELGIPADISGSLNIIADGYTKICDLIDIQNYCLCLHLADVGLNAHLIKHFDESSKRGMVGYALVIFKTLWRKRKLKIKFTVNGEIIEREAFMVALANASKYGTGAVINPESKLDDGLFEIVVVRHLNFWALVKMLLHPGLFNPEKIEIFKVEEVNISSRHAMYFQIDGEYKGKIKKVCANVKKHALNILVRNGQEVNRV